jgi:hypothetical protein
MKFFIHKNLKLFNVELTFIFCFSEISIHFSDFINWTWAQRKTFSKNQKISDLSWESINAPESQTDFRTMLSYIVVFYPVFGTLEWVRFSVRFFWIFWVPVRFWVLRFMFGFGSGSQILENLGSGFGSRFQLIKKYSWKSIPKWILSAKFFTFFV